MIPVHGSGSPYLDRRSRGCRIPSREAEEFLLKIYGEFLNVSQHLGGMLRYRSGQMVAEFGPFIAWKRAAAQVS